MKRFSATTLGALLIATLGLSHAPVTIAQDVTQLRWATSAVGSAGHRAKVALMAMLNREMPDYAITVLPMPGALATVRGYATNQVDGYYGADIAFRELAANEGRFRGFREQMQREPVQSFWAYTMEVGVGVRASEVGNLSGWGDLEGRPVFSGPAPWDVRAQLERGLATVDAGHRYVEVDLGLAGNALVNGTIDGFVIYSTGESNPAPWVTEAILSADVAALNPSADEIEALRTAGIDVVTVPGSVFQDRVGAESVTLVPFFYGFHVGLEVPAEDVHRMLNLIESNAQELATIDSAFRQIRDDMVGIQTRGVAASIDAVKVHPGLALYLQEKGAWNPEWDDRIASLEETARNLASGN